MSFKLVFGLGAAVVLAPLNAADADPVLKWGSAIYPQRAMVAPAPVSALAQPQAFSEARPLTGRRRDAHGRRRSQVAAGSPIETQLPPSPTPSQAKDAASSPDPKSDGPHEAPAPTLKDLVSRHARENGVPEKLASAVVRIESNFNPGARGGSALGLMQIKVETARSMGFSGSARGLMEPETNLHFGMKVLADAFKASRGDVCMTLARYQSGHLTTHMSANRAYCAHARAFIAKL